ncbi:MAG: hypothetical protein A2901_06185 [Elusimicrobia bacterium RIFCSPLOWO2_01_FULL_54_10]|nr:MAG: hypothetical protein A2901_06185 [Elusimicrobia bacterium RIFCSPLOWO2_01_FULL_54_10]
MIESAVQPLTTHEVSRYLHVDLSTVINWCDQGKLEAYKTPGGHRRVSRENFLKFLKQYEIPMSADIKRSLQGGTRILIVDDEADVRKVINRVLMKSLPMAEIVEAEDGFEAGKMLLDARPHLVILDLKLPGMDGFKVCANIRADDRFKETKILAVTGQDTSENKARILEAGADDYLPKPFALEVLDEKAARLLGFEKAAVK